MQARERRVAENEVRFRALNERLRDSGGVWEGRDGIMSLVCECGDEDCTMPITLTPAEYESSAGGDAVRDRTRARASRGGGRRLRAGRLGCRAEARRGGRDRGRERSPRE